MLASNPCQTSDSQLNPKNASYPGQNKVLPFSEPNAVRVLAHNPAQTKRVRPAENLNPFTAASPASPKVLSIACQPTLLEKRAKLHHQAQFPTSSSKLPLRSREQIWSCAAIVSPEPDFAGQRRHEQGPGPHSRIRCRPGPAPKRQSSSTIARIQTQAG